jgi:diguanylate cyclase (GGDEF)-like protein
MQIFFHNVLILLQKLCLIAAVFFMTSSVQAIDEVPSYQLKQDQHSVVNYYHRVVNTSQHLNFNEISDLSNKKWQKTHLSNGDLFIMPGQNWFAFELENNTLVSKQIYIDLVNQIRMNNVELFIRDKTQNIIQKILELKRSNNRSVSLKVDPSTSVFLYLKIESLTQLRSSVKIYSSVKYIEESGSLLFKQGIAIGGLLCLTLAFVLLFFATGSKSIVILCGYFSSNALMLSAILGFNLHYLFPHLPDLIGIEIPLLTAISMIFLLVFTAQLFNLKTKFPNIYQVIRISLWALILYMPLSIQLSVTDNINISMAIYTLVIFSLIVTGLYLHKNACRLALLFSVVMSAQFVFASICVVSVNWLDVGFIAYRSIFYGIVSWLHCLLITFILSRQYRDHLREKQEAQQQALSSAITTKQAQEELLKMQSQSQEDLENRVQERTIELNIALQELEEANRELEQKNTIDELTGLFNRRFYDQKILAEYRRSKRNLTPLSLVLIDIDHFKAVNDTHGHLAGDHCLSWLSEHIKKSLKRSTDMAFRYGGEEFCLILPDTDGKGAVALAETLRENIAKEACTYKDLTIPLTISNGIFTYLQQDNVMPEQVFANADKALYQAKHDGRNQTQECKNSFE